MSPTEKLLQGIFGQSGFDQFAQTLAKGEAKYGKGTMGAYIPAMVAPRAVMAWLYESAALMKTVDQREFKVPGSEGHSVKLHKLGQLFNAELRKDGKVLCKFEAQAFQSAVDNTSVQGHFADLVKSIVHSCGVHPQATAEDARKALELGNKIEVTASMGRLIDSLVKAEDDQTSLTNKPLRGKDKEMRAENDTTPGKDASSKQPSEKFVTPRMSIAEMRAEKIDPELARRRPSSEKIKQGEEAADGKTGTESIPKIPEAALKAEANPDEKEDAKLGEDVEHLTEDHMLRNKSAEIKEGHKIFGKAELGGHRSLRSCLHKDSPNATPSPNPSPAPSGIGSTFSGSNPVAQGVSNVFKGAHPSDLKTRHNQEMGVHLAYSGTPNSGQSNSLGHAVRTGNRAKQALNDMPITRRIGEHIDRAAGMPFTLPGTISRERQNARQIVRNVIAQQRAMPKPNLPKSEPMGKAGMGVDKPGGAAIPKMPSMPKPPMPGALPSKAPAASASRQSMGAAKGLSAPTKMSSSGKPKTMGFGPPPDTMKMGKSETRLSEDEVYARCEHCGQPEFSRSAAGPQFTPCACFMALTKDDEGNPTHFVALRKAQDGSYRISFDPSVDKDAAKVFLLGLKSRLLVKKKFGV